MTANTRRNLTDAAMVKVRAVQEILRRWDPINVAPGTIALQMNTIATRIILSRWWTAAARSTTSRRISKIFASRRWVSALVQQRAGRTASSSPDRLSAYCVREILARADREADSRHMCTYALKYAATRGGSLAIVLRAYRAKTRRPSGGPGSRVC